MSAPVGEQRRILVGVDGSEPSKLALRWAAFLAGSSGARIDAVMTWQNPTYGWAGGWAVALPSVDFSAECAKELNATLDEVFGPDRPAALQVRVLEGNAARVLTELSEGAEVLVVGSRGRGGFTGLLLGSVSRHLAERSKCPVLVIHGDRQPPA
jgi:nucleotide-binding universal stress UspA family protein